MYSDKIILSYYQHDRSKCKKKFNTSAIYECLFIKEKTLTLKDPGLLPTKGPGEG